MPTRDAARQLWEDLAALAQRVTPPEKASLVLFVEWIEMLLSAEEEMDRETQPDPR